MQLHKCNPHFKLWISGTCSIESQRFFLQLLPFTVHVYFNISRKIMASLRWPAPAYEISTDSSGCLSKGILPAQMFSMSMKKKGKKSKLEHQKVLSLFRVRLCSWQPNWCLNWHSWCGFKTRCHMRWSKQNLLTLIKSQPHKADPWAFISRFLKHWL